MISRLTDNPRALIIGAMKTNPENLLEEVLRHNIGFITACQLFGWGKIEITIKDGKAVMVTVMRDIKLN